MTTAATAGKNRRSINFRNAKFPQIVKNSNRIVKRKILIELQPVSCQRDAGRNHGVKRPKYAVRLEVRSIPSSRLPLQDRYFLPPSAAPQWLSSAPHKKCFELPIASRGTAKFAPTPTVFEIAANFPCRRDVPRTALPALQAACES